MHPSETAYAAGCGCEPCLTRRRRIDKIRKIYGVDMVHAEPVRLWVKQLVSEGWVIEQIARAANADPKTVWNILTADQQRIHGTQGRSLLGLTRQQIITVAEPGEEVPCLGATRRMHALMRIGWSHRILASTTNEEQMIRRVSRGRNFRIKARTYRQVADLFDRLMFIPGPSSSARVRAEKRGFAPPLAWDDETIDDPNAQPDTGEPKVNQAHPRHEQLLALHGQGLSDGQVGAVIGVTADAIRHWRLRNQIPPNIKSRRVELGDEPDDRYRLWQNGLTDQQIADQTGRHPDLIRKWRGKHGLKAAGRWPAA